MANNKKTFLESVITCVREADEQGLLSEKGLDSLGGLSGLKTVGVLQRLTGLFSDQNDACYLEVGVFQGLTLLSVALSQPGVSCFGIDDFSILDPDEKNFYLVNDRLEKLNVTNAALINEGFEEAFEHLDDYLKGRKIGVYFYDGAHDYRSQIMGLMLVQPLLHENCVLIIDDANYEFVRQSTVDFLKSCPDFKLVFEGYSPAHPANMDEATRKHHEAGWLNGINILARDTGNLLPDMLPPVNPDKTLYVNDWLVHRHRLAELAPEALNVAGSICAGDVAEVDARNKLTSLYETEKNRFDTRHADRNLHNQGQPKSRLNSV